MENMGLDDRPVSNVPGSQVVSTTLNCLKLREPEILGIIAKDY